MRNLGMRDSLYLASLDQDKETLKPLLDKVIRKHKGQIVGNGYIDIIVSRDNYAALMQDLSSSNFAIEAISWWCHCTPKNQKTYGCPHGYGGPRSEFYEGWFSERVHDFDELSIEKLDKTGAFHSADTVKALNNEALQIIENKRTITYGDGTYQLFYRDKCLTPGLWLHVPESWKSSEK